MTALNPLDLVKAAPWTNVLFTTYALSLSFFEAVVVDALVRGGSKNSLILSDPEGIRAGLSERGARLVGRDYELLPVHRTSGVFHPKLIGFLAQDDAHLLVGSGNLTFGGWGGNCEVIEHLHPGFAPEAIVDAAEFLELLQVDEQIRLPEGVDLSKFADGLRLAAAGKTGTGRIRIVHNAGGTIANQLRQEAEELGGAERLCFASAFYDANGVGVAKLADLLNCADVSAYVHPAGSVQGHAGCNWPGLSAEQLAAVTLDTDFAQDNRLLHAKAIEIVCRKGRLILSGSVNATHAALFGANMEVGVLRIEPNRHGAWTLDRCPAPAQISFADDDDETSEVRRQVLSAELVGTSIRGTVVSAWSAGPATMTCEVEGELVELGDVDVDHNGNFAGPVPGLAERIWSRGRVVIRLSAGDAVAEGFLTITAVAEIVRRAGPAASRILSVLTGTETPQDVAAIMGWFHEDPSRMPQAALRAQGKGRDEEGEKNQIVTAAMLGNAQIVGKGEQGPNERSTGWQSAMSALLTAFRSNRGPFRSEVQETGDEGEDPSEAETAEQTRNEKANEKAMDAFSKLLDAALKDDGDGCYAETMVALAHYLVDRIRPPNERVILWLDKIMRGLPPMVERELAADILALQLLLVANSPSADVALKARRLLVRQNLLPDLAMADANRLPAFHAYLPPAIGLEEAREMLAKVRTHREELMVLLDAPAQEDLPALPMLATSDHWPDLQRIHNGRLSRERVEFVAGPVSSCPRCNMALPTGNAHELRQFGVTRCTNRCGRLICSLEA